MVPGAFGVMSKHKQTGTAFAPARREFESLGQAAERTGLSSRTLRRRIADGSLPAYRNGGRVIRVDPRDVDRLMIRIPTVSA